MDKKKHKENKRKKNIILFLQQAKVAKNNSKYIRKYLFLFFFSFPVILQYFSNKETAFDQFSNTSKIKRNECRMNIYDFFISIKLT